MPPLTASLPSLDRLDARAKAPELGLPHGLVAEAPPAADRIPPPTKWSRSLRVLVMVGASALLWAAIAGLAMLAGGLLF